MHEPVIAYIKKHSTTPLTEGDIEAIKDVFVPRKIRKHQYLQQEGDVCKYAAFIVKGAMRLFTVDDEGVEHIVRLFIENWVVVDRPNWSAQTVSEYNIDAWEDSDVLLVTRADYENRLMSIPAIMESTMYHFERFASETQKRVASLALSAEKRYAELMNIYPEFIQRFPQHIIASYLGITKETLSRIRSHKVKK